MAMSSNGWRRSQTNNTKVELMSLKSSFIKREKTAKKKLTFLALALAMCLNQIACGAGRSTVSSTPPAQTNEVSNKQAEDMKIRITIGSKVVTATLTNSEATRDFVSCCR
jgi:hypothetical protein